MKTKIHPLALIALLSLCNISQAQQITTKYDKYMYGGGPHHVWWHSISSDLHKARYGGGNSKREDAKPGTVQARNLFSENLIPLPYLYDKDFAKNSRKNRRDEICVLNNHLHPQHLVDELGKPASPGFLKATSRWGTVGHYMTYEWSKDIYTDREYIVLEKKIREIVGVEATLKKTTGDFSRNDMAAARRSKWVINNAVLNLVPLKRGCILNMCNPAHPCPGHGIPAATTDRIEKTKTIAEQMFLQEAYAKYLESKFARSKELQIQLTKESSWYYRKSLRVRRNGAIAKK